jgi:hypothetical protein
MCWGPSKGEIVKKAIIGVGIVALLGISLWYTVGGASKKNDSFGAATGTVVTSVADIYKHPAKYLNETVTVEGEVSKECPTGCWWYVKDQTGEIRADSLGAGFNLLVNQEGHTVRTTGKVTKMEGGDLQLVALGAKLR